MSIYIHHVPQHSPAEMAEVHAAVETLYRDELRPYGRILRKRLTERAQATGRGAVDIDVRLLRDLCAASPWLLVQEEEGGDWSALLRCRPATFVDVYSPQDVYPADLWPAAQAYFGSLSDNEMVLPGGRYLCAQVLAARQLRFLAGRSLGQICHIVQLAISQKKILGYLNGAIVPYHRSQSMVKERCAEHQRPCSNAARKAGAVANWDTLHACVHELVRSLSPGTGGLIPLSNVKRLFRSRFRIELSETALGYAKLSELFQDARLQDVCAVRLQGQGYVIVPAAQVDGSKPISLAASLPSQSGGGDGVGEAARPSNASLRSRARWIEPLSPEDLASPAPPPATAPGAGSSTPTSWARDDGGGAGGGSQTVFPPTPSPTSMRAPALPTLLGGLRGRREAVKQDGGGQAQGGGGGLAGEGGRGADLCIPEDASGHSADVPSQAADEDAEAHACAAAVMAHAGAAAAMAHAAMAAMTGPAAAPSYGDGLLEAAQLQPPALAPAEAALPGLPHVASMPVLLTPTALGDLGFMVQNTFIHATLPSAAPCQGPFRAHSMPRNLRPDRPQFSPAARHRAR